MRVSFFTGLFLAFTLSFTAFADENGDEFELEMNGAKAWARGSVINTTYNTTFENGRWKATMGPLTDFFGGLACDHRASEEGDAEKYRKGDYAVWFIAPSDAMDMLGLKHCSTNPYGGEPSCVENWNLCGRKMRLRCKAGSTWCANPGSQSLLADINSGRKPRNNYIPDYYVQRTQERVGPRPSVPHSVVLYITDFCPKEHSENKKGGQCQGPQVDVSTPAFLLLAKQNQQGYIDANVEYEVEMMDEGDRTPAGPEWSASPAPYPYCKSENGRGYGDTWQSGSWILAKDSPDFSEASTCIVSRSIK